MPNQANCGREAVPWLRFVQLGGQLGLISSDPGHHQGCVVLSPREQGKQEACW